MCLVKRKDDDTFSYYRNCSNTPGELNLSSPPSLKRDNDREMRKEDCKKQRLVNLDDRHKFKKEVDDLL